MKVLVDTPIWSFALRRRPEQLDDEQRRLVAELTELVREGRAALTGDIRQEVLSGVADLGRWTRLRDALRRFTDEPLTTVDYERAAEAFSLCRARGIQSTPVDLLICAIAERLEMPIFTTDGDFPHYARVLPIALHRVRSELR